VETIGAIAQNFEIEINFRGGSQNIAGHHASPSSKPSLLSVFPLLLGNVSDFSR
jgi:hypothetical protein